MSKKPSIPRSGADFDVYFNNIVNYTLERVISANPVWTHIPKPETEALSAAYAAWHAAYEKTLVPHSPVVTAEKNRVRTSSQKTLEDFTNRFLLRQTVLWGEKFSGFLNKDKKSRLPEVTKRLIHDSFFASAKTPELTGKE
jgi:hypothetical protein